MSEYRQPWTRVRLAGRRCHLQILDPATAFELEPELVRTLGDTLSFSAAAPGEVLAGVWQHATAGPDFDVRGLVTDPVRGPALATEMLTGLGLLLAQCIAAVPGDASLMRRMFATLVLERIKVDDVVIEDAEDWTALGMPVLAKWQAMVLQLRQTFGPLWTRSPYSSGARSKDYGIPRPTSVPIAVQWADSIARLGSASSVNEILHEWTPVRMIEVVESAAYLAANEQRAMDESRGDGGSR